MKQVTIGIDIGGTNTVIGVVNKDGDVLVRDSISTPQHGDAKLYVQDIKKAVTNLLAELQPQREVLGIGIGAPNGNYYRGTIEDAPNLSFVGVVPLVELLKAEFPEMGAIALTNDANAATLGEMIYGGAQDMKNFVMYTMGTGVGSGIVANGDLIYGKDGFAGECGHVILVPDGRTCACGIPGHLEAYCSAPGMKRTAFELLAHYNDNESPLAKKSFRDLTSKDIYDAAIAGDAIAKEVFEVTGEYLGKAMASTVHTLSPEAVFLFGGPTAAGDLILNPTQKSLDKYLLPIFKGTVPVIVSKLSLGDAAIVGASSLVMKELDK
ncbi:MAG: ROK family protein [Bacteroidales bacterium]|jgi:glucokinase|nr:ROK family protein [Bacteroidales bacterium]